MAILVACGLSESAPEHDGRAPPEWRPEALEPDQARLASDRASAVSSWRVRPDEHAALALAKTYYPELFGVERPGATAAVRPETAVSVTFPEHANEPMELSTRGHVFRVTRLDAKGGGTVRHGDEAISYGPARLWAPAGPAQHRGRSVVAQRVEEYDIVESGGEHRATYRLELAPGVAGLRATGDTIELSDGRGGPPVLRLHAPEVRDSKGAARKGTVELGGVIAGGRPDSFLASGLSVDVTVRVRLDGLIGPLVVDPGWSSTASMSTARVLHTATVLQSGEVLVSGGTNGSATLATSELYDPTSDTWTGTTGPMTKARAWHTATLLGSGKVLVVGGQNDSGFASGAELFDPVGGTWTATAPPVSANRQMHAATLLQSGKVLVTGGHNGSAMNVAEVFDPVGGGWAATTTTMTAAHFSHTATLLQSGKVLVVGGQGSAGSQNASELYDPGTGAWTTIAASMTLMRTSHDATLLPSGQVLISGGWDGTTGKPTTSTELFDPAALTWTASGAMTAPRDFHTATLLSSGKVLVTGGNDGTSSLGSAELYTPGTGTWALVLAPMASTRRYHTAALLPGGSVLLAGGMSTLALKSAEVFDPSDGNWGAAAAMAITRANHTTTLLGSGKVLVAGGQDATGSLDTFEVFDPSGGTWSSPSTTLTVARASHTATLLGSGKVLVAGGLDGTAAPSNRAELYDPRPGTWAATATTMAAARASHCAVLLQSGLVLVAGGRDASGPLATAELYDPATGQWTATAPMSSARTSATATLLPSGKVLIAGGATASGPQSTAELFDPTSGTFSPLGSPMTTARAAHTATLLPSGSVLIAGGTDGATALASSELFNPGTGGWTAVAAPMTAARTAHTATLLTSGKVFVSGGEGPLRSAELFDPASGAWAPALSMTAPRASHTATLLPSGKVFLAGGRGPTGPISSADLFDPGAGTWTATTTMTVSRSSHTATLLLNGKVLVAGGFGTSTYLNSAKLFDPAAGTWSAPTVPMTSTRSTHSATLLPSGLVLVAGGWTGSAAVNTAEVFDPSNGSWIAIAPMSVERMSHTASLLPSGKVLVAGGADTAGTPQSAETFDPVDGGWSPTSPMIVPRLGHLAVSLPSGKVLVAGGWGTSSTLDSAELFDPDGGTWAPTAGPMTTPRSGATATVLLSGQVLIAGGRTTGAPFSSAEIYDPNSRSFVAIAPMAVARWGHTATLLPSGVVLVTGGHDANNTSLSSVQLFDPATGAWAPSVTLTSARGDHTATILPSGKVLVAGGTSGSSSVASAELYEGTGALDAWRPAVSGPAALTMGRVVTVTGTRLRGLSGASGGGTNDSPTDFPIVSLRPMDGSWLIRLDRSTLSPTSAGVLVPSALPPQPFVLEVVVNGVSGGRIVTLKSNTAPVATAQSLTTLEDVPLGLTLAGTDADGDPLTFAVTAQPSSGVLTGSGATRTYTPGANANGSDAFTFKANDGLADSPAATVALTITPVNDAPVFPAIADRTIPQDSPLTVQVTGVGPGGGADEAAQTVTLTATSSNPAVVPDPTVTGGSGTWTLSFVPAPLAIGTTTITVTARDSGGTANSGVDVFSRTFTLTVTPANHPPVFDPVANQTVLEDTSGGATITGVGPGGGSDELGQSVTVTAASSDPAVVPNPSVTGSGATRSLAFTPASNATGAVVITVTAQDDGGTADGGLDTSTRTFSITVTPVNDAPVFASVANQTTLEDTATDVVVTGVGPGGGPDEAAQAVTLTATSSDTSLVPDPTVSGGGATRTVTLSPSSHAVGTVTITVVARDSGGVANGGVDAFTRTFSFTITPVNDAPSFDALATQTVIEDTPASVAVTGVGSGGGPDEAAQAVTLTATSSDPTVVPNPTVTGTGASRGLLITPVANAVGTVVITVTAKDDGGTANGGADTFSRTFGVTVSPVNDAPTLAAVTDQTQLEDLPAPVVVTGVGPGGGADEASQTVTVTASSSNQTIMPNPTVSGSGATRTLTFAPARDANGTVVVTVTATDDGGGSTDSSSSTFTLTFVPVNDAPTLGDIANQTVVNDFGRHSLQVPGVSPGGGADEASQTVTVTATSSDPGIIPAPTVTGTGPARTLTYSMVAGARGSVVVTVSAQDDGGIANGGFDTLAKTFVIDVSSVNHAPIAESGSVSTTGAPVDIVLHATDPDQDPLSYSVMSQPEHGVLTGTVPNLTYTPEAGYRGVDSLTFKVSDGFVESAPATFSITVNTAVGPTTSYFGFSCGCSAGDPGSGQGPWGLALLAGLLALRRRRPPFPAAHSSSSTSRVASGRAFALLVCAALGLASPPALAKPTAKPGAPAPTGGTMTVKIKGKSSKSPASPPSPPPALGAGVGGSGPTTSASDGPAPATVPASPSFVPAAPAAATTPPAPPAELASAPPAPAASAPPPRLKLAFLGVTAGSGVEQATARAVSGYLESELNSFNAYEVTGPAAISAVVGVEKQKQLLGCEEDSSTSCLTEVANALNADRTVSGDLSLVGDAILLNLTLVDLKTTKPISRVGRRVTGFFGSVDTVLDAAGPAVAELISKDPVLAGRVFTVERTFGGLLVSLRVEGDIAGRSVAPCVSAELTGRRFGAAIGVLIGPTPGFRAELRYFPVELGRVRPYLGGGGTLFAPAVSVRGAVGVEVRLGSVHLFADGAYERLFNPAPKYFPNAVLLAAGAGWLF